MALTTLWLPDAPPLSPGADDDEFADASGGVPGGWTEYDHGALQTVDEDAAGAELIQSTHAGSALSGIYKALPGAGVDFTYWTKVSLSGLGVTSTIAAGIALLEDAAVSTGDVRTYMLRANATQGEIAVHPWTAYNALGAATVTHAISVDTGPTSLYLMVRRTGTTYAFSYSTDGLGWMRTLSTGALGIVPIHIALCMDNIASAADVSARFKFYRHVASDVGLTPLMGGRRVTVST